MRHPNFKVLRVISSRVSTVVPNSVRGGIFIIVISTVEEILLVIDSCHSIGHLVVQRSHVNILLTIVIFNHSMMLLIVFIGVLVYTMAIVHAIINRQLNLHIEIAVLILIGISSVFSLFGCGLDFPLALLRSFGNLFAVLFIRSCQSALIYNNGS